MDELKENDLRVEWSEAEDREPIDFDIRDTKTDERYATVWGSEPFNDVQADCEHPEHMIEYDDDEHVGECLLCGSTCFWHNEVDDGNVEDYHWHSSRRVPHEWTGDCKGGIIGKLIEKEKEKF